MTSTDKSSKRKDVVIIILGICLGLAVLFALAQRSSVQLLQEDNDTLKALLNLCTESPVTAQKP
jgi:hypothetical protein